LYFTIGARSLGETAAANSINFVHENDAWLVLPGITKHLSYYTRRLANVFVNDSRGDDLEEIGLQRGGNSPCKKGLPRSWWTVEQNTFRRRDSYASEELRTEQGEFNNL